MRFKTAERQEKGVKKEKWPKPIKKKRGDRKDARWLRNLDPMHAFTPYLYPDRADNEAFISERIDLTNINAYMERKTQKIRKWNISCFRLL